VTTMIIDACYVNDLRQTEHEMFTSTKKIG